MFTHAELQQIPKEVVPTFENELGETSAPWMCLASSSHPK